ncbi:hypothetical protein L226DRAFT_571505 [Lentinus tigrinus ALCF2SS1-7]|uniref:Uncharacterized protein n=1 Tax=Lentinus tigrinus ALCF2SS1-6 TaxID=1328759 RepID=A0A5C2SEH3_9APHY|nr:hypothetical protein L227DRAFT_609989 [Lentinus tigrinus ALCF2SS1-6]RPD74639.1 hypothetical protein L226DRAFT_571505 [Lentinus tigrinus ALCF2SS1-7]
MTSGRLTPLTSCADGLGILPSAESLDHRSVLSLALTGSTCTISSIADPDGTRGRSRAKTMRTKEIEKSPIPHRFHLVPSGRRRPYQPPSISPKPTTKWRCNERGEGADTESVYSAISPSLYEMDASPEPAQDRDELQRSVIEDLVSDALQSPVFESYRPSHIDLDCVPSPQASSFTLVNEQSSKSKRFSSMYKSAQETCEPDIVESGEQILHAPLLQLLEPSLSSADVYENDDMCDYAEHDDDDALCYHATDEECVLMDSPRIHDSLPDTRGEDLHEDAVPSFMSPEDARSSSSNRTLPDTSLSSYSVHSDRSDISVPRPPPSDSMRSMMNRRATEMSFGSTTNLPSPRDRRFALRRQAIYAEYGFQIAFPESDSESSLRQAPHSPSKPHKKGHAVGGRAASASAYVFSAGATGIPRSAWSTSTSGASLKSVADLADASPYPSPLPSIVGLNLAQANDKLERFSVQEDLLASSRIAFAKDSGSMTTSTPALSLKSRSLRSLAPNASGRAGGISPSLFSTVETPGSTSTSLPVSVSRPQEAKPWTPLRLIKRDSSDPLVLCVPVAPRGRAERSAIWQEDPGHHPIVEALLGEVRRAIEEWKGICAVVIYF